MQPRIHVFKASGENVTITLKDDGKYYWKATKFQSQGHDSLSASMQSVVGFIATIKRNKIMKYGTIRVKDVELHKEAKSCAAKKGLTFIEYMEKALRYYIKKNPKD